MRSWPAPMGAVWIHASSVGEVGAAEVLWNALDGPRFLSTDTDGGLVRARRFTPMCARLPIDLPWALAPLWAQARPRAIIFVEGTFWPGLARLARRAGVPVLRVSCKVGPGTRRVPVAALRRLWAPTTAVAARDEAEAVFLRQVHARVEVLGDLKQGIRPTPSPLRWHRPFVAAMSLRREERGHLLQARTALPDHQLLWAPRHPHPSDVDALDGLRWLRRSEVDTDVPADVDVVYVDGVGELGSLIEGAAAAFVGGAFDPGITGHSPREALAWGIPVVLGPQHAPCEGAVVVREPGSVGLALLRAMKEGPRARPQSHVGERVASFVRGHLGAPAAEASPRPWARPLCAPYALGWVAAQVVGGLRPTTRLPVPVVSVGSANARSPGRTSTVAWIVDRLSERGHRVGVALRGYRREARGLQGSWDGVGSERLGDEGAMLAWRGAVVAAASDRVAAAKALVAHGCTVVVLDDGQQCRWLFRDVDIDVVDGRYPQARGLLPAGERRSIGSRGGDVRLVHHPQPDSLGIRVTRRPGPWFRGHSAAAPPEGPVALWLGIGHPEDVLASLELPIGRQRVDRDHAAPTDLQAWSDGLPLVCTSKDWTRLPKTLASTTWHRGLELSIPDDHWLPS